MISKDDLLKIRAEIWRQRNSRLRKLGSVGAWMLAIGIIAIVSMSGLRGVQNITPSETYRPHWVSMPDATRYLGLAGFVVALCGFLLLIIANNMSRANGKE